MENEIKTNKIALKALVALNALVAFFAFGGLVGILRIGFSWNSWALLTCCIIVVPMCITVCKIGYDHPFSKNLIIFGIILLSGMVHFNYAATTVVLIFGPTLVSIKYYNPKFVLKITAITWIVFITIITCNHIFDKIIPAIHLLHVYEANYGWSFGKDVFMYIALPRTLVFAAEAVAGYLIAQGGRELVLAQAKASFQAYSRENEMITAAAVQKAALPGHEFISPDKNIHINSYLRTARDVGGDFYDHFMLNDHMLVVLIADVSDKGLPSAMYGIEALSIIRFALSEGLVKNEEGLIDCINLEDTVESVNRQLAIHDMNGMFVTMWIACIDTRTGVGKYINAGHNLPFIKHKDGSIEVIDNEPQLFMGAFTDAEHKARPIGLLTGDTLILYTDGVTDARDEDDKPFGETKLKEIIKKFGVNDSANASKELCDRISNAVNRHINDQLPFDDITLLTLNFIGEDTDHYEESTLEVGEDSTELMIDKIDNLLVSAGCPENDRRNIDLVIDEVCANISEYAYEDGKGQVNISTHIGNNYIAVRFIDSGVHFNPLESEYPDLSGEPKIGGLGIYLIKSLVDRIDYEYKDGKNILTIFRIWNM